MPKTVTQIVFEQLEGMPTRLRYGSKTKTLWDHVSKAKYWRCVGQLLHKIQGYCSCYCVVCWDFGLVWGWVS